MRQPTFLMHSRLKGIILCRKEGFTLVEVLLGAAIISVIGLAVSNVFWTSMKLDDKLRLIHENYMEVLIADQAMTRDLENALSLDYSANYSDLKIFSGEKRAVEFLTATNNGIKRVRYYSGLIDFGKATKTIIGKKIRRLSKESFNKDSLPIEFLLRQESSLSDWMNQSRDKAKVEIIAAGLKKDSFVCQYAPPSKDIAALGPKAVTYKDQWNQAGMPISVSCRFAMYDPRNPKADINFKRDFFLSPVWMGNEG